MLIILINTVFEKFSFVPLLQYKSFKRKFFIKCKNHWEEKISKDSHQYLVLLKHLLYQHMSDLPRKKSE